MKITLVKATILGLLLSSSVSFAASQDEQTDLELEAAALAQVSQGQAIHDRSFLGFDLTNPLSFFGKLKDQVDSVKETLLASFDTDGNGKIDPGPETVAFKEGIKAIALVFGDSNQNGKIDAEDIVVLSKLAFTKVEEQAFAAVCPAIEAQAEGAGSFLVFRPVLKHMNDVCLAHEAALAAGI